MKSQRKRKAQAGVLRTNVERKRRLGKTVKQKLKQEERRRLENTMWLKPTRAKGTGWRNGKHKLKQDARRRLEKIMWRKPTRT